VTNSWRNAREAVGAIHETARLQAARRVKGFQRLDIALILVVAAFVLSVSAAVSLIVLGHQKYGWFDPPAFAPTEDARRLTNIRSDEFSSPIADAEIDLASGDLIVIRRDGVLHRMNLSSELWSEERIDNATLGMTGSFSAVSAECAGAPSSANCAGGRLFLLTDAGGLAMQDAAGRWHPLVTDAAWRGRSGDAVQHEALTSAALSSDMRWLLLAAGREGLGLFDQAGNRWAVVDRNRQAQLFGTAAVDRVLWAMGRFWAAGSFGLASLDITADEARLFKITSVDGAVLDVEVEPDGGLIVLSRASCDTASQTCLRVLRVDRDGESVLVAGELDRDPDLSMAGLRHAAIQAGRVVVFGDAGGHEYDPARRSWRRIFGDPVDIVLESFDETEVFAAAAGQVLLVRAANVVESWALPGEKIERLARWPDGSVIALTQNETLYRLEDGGAAVRLRDKQSVAFQPGDARAAATAGDSLIFDDGDSLVLHSTRSRRYAKIPRAQAPPVFLTSTDPIQSDGSQSIWRMDARSIARMTVVDRADQPLGGTFKTLSLSTPYFRFRPDPSGGYGLSEVDGVHRVSTSQVGLVEQTLTGSPRPNTLDEPVALQVIGNGDLLTADRQHLWRYSLAERGWSGPRSPNLAAQAIVDFARDGSIDYFVGDGGLLTSGIAEAQPQSMLGHGPGFPFSASELEDAVRDDLGRVQLAAAGRITAYDPIERRIVQTWEPPGAGAISLAGTVSGVPVGRRGDALFFGNRALTLPDARGVSISLARDRIVTVQERRRNRFLAMHPLDADGPPSCLFLNPSPPPGEISDAASLPAGRIAFSIAGRVAIYNPMLRSWRSAEPVLGASNRRLSILGDALAFHDKNSFSAFPLNSLREGESCEPAALPSPAQSVARKAVTVDEARGEAAFLGADEAVSVWRGGRVANILPGSGGGGPSPSALRRVFADGAHIAFLTERDFWWYDTASRRWTKTRFVGVDPNRVSSLDAKRVGEGRFAVSMWLDDGRSFGAVVARGASRAVFDELSGLPLPRAGSDFSDLLDAAQLDGRWLFLFPDRVLWMQPSPNGRRAELTFETARTDRRLISFQGRLAIEEGASGAILYLPVDDEGTPARAAIAERAAIVDRGLIRSLALVNAQSDRPQLWLVDRDGTARSCPLRAGALVVSECPALTSRPVALDPDEVGAAYAAPSGEIVIFGEGAVRLLDRANRRITSLSLDDDAGRFEGLEAYQTDDTLLLLSNDGLLRRLDVEAGLQVAASGVAALYAGPDARGRLSWVARRDGGLDLLNSSGRILSAAASWRALAPEGPAVGDVALFTALPRGFTALTSQGEIVEVVGRNVRRISLLQRSGLPPLGDPRAVIPGTIDAEGDSVRGLWVQAAGHLRFIRPAACPHDDPSAEGSTIFRCAAVEMTLPAPSDDRGGPLVVRDVERFGSGILEFQTDSARFRWADGRLERLQSRAPALPPPDRAADVTAELRRSTTILADGDAYLDVPTLTSHAGRVELNPQTADPITREGGDTRTVLDPLSTAWMSWDRERALFSVRGRQADAAVSPEAFTQGGRFMPDASGRFYLFDENQVVGINEHGRWFYPWRNGRVGAPVYAPMEIGTARMDVAHGRLLVSDRSAPVEGGAFAQDAGETVLTWDGLTIREDWRTRQVDARLSGPGGSDVAAFGERGFAFDRREDLGWVNGRLAILTPIGVVAAAELEALADRPHAESDAGSFFHLSGDLYAKGPQGWSRFTDQTWTPVEDPFANRRLVETARRQWSMQAGELAVTAPPAESPEWAKRDADGGFLVDKIRGVGADADAVVVNTASATLFASDAGALSSGLVRLASAPPVSRSVQVVLDQGSTNILAGDAAAASLWNTRTGQWGPAQISPLFRDRIGGTAQGLELKLVKGGWVASVEMTEASTGARVERRFQWGRGDHFPFDRARAVEPLDPSGVAVATDFGLLVVGQGGRELFDISRDAQPGPVASLGRPQSRPSELVAQGAGACAVWRSGAWSSCERQVDLSARFLGETGFWRWTSDDGLTGRYLVDAAPIGAPIAGLREDRFPHDAPTDLMSCAGRAYALREDGVLETHLRGYGAPNQGVTSLAPPDGSRTPRRLHCVHTSEILDGGQTLQAGLYLLSAGEAVLLVGNAWNGVGPRQAEAVAARAEGAQTAMIGRFRARSGADGWRIEHRSLSDEWRPLSWVEDRLAIDAMNGPLTAAHRYLWSMTPEGFVPVPAFVGGVDPADFLIIDLERTAPSCVVDQIASYNGLVWRAPRTAQQETILRCADGRLFEGVLDGTRDRGVFVAREEDPFLERAVVLRLGDNEMRWRVSHSAGARPVLSARYLDEEVSLTAGRFGFDDLRDLAVFQNDRVEQLSSAGWRRVGGSLGLATMTRFTAGGIDPSDAERLMVDRGPDGGRVLCVDFRRGGSVALQASGSRSAGVACYQFLAADDLWAYRFDGDAVSGLAQSVDGPMVARELRDGRFSDLYVTGAPIADPLDASRLLVPTSSGAIQLTERGRQEALYDLPGKGGLLAHAGGVFHLSRSGLAALPGHAGDSPCDSLATVAQSLQEDEAIMILRRDRPGLWTLVSAGGERRRQFSVFCTARESLVARWVAEAPLAERSRFLANSSSESNHRALYFWLVNGDVVTTFGETDVSFAARSLRGDALRVLAGPDAFFTVTDQEIYSGDIDALTLLALEGREIQEPLNGRASPGVSDGAQQFVDPPDRAGLDSDAPRAGDVRDAAEDRSALVLPAGMTRDERIIIQRRLQTLGYYDGEADGLFGPLTREAVRRLQAAQGAEASGRLTREQFDELIGADR